MASSSYALPMATALALCLSCCKVLERSTIPAPPCIEHTRDVMRTCSWRYLPALLAISLRYTLS